MHNFCCSTSSEVYADCFPSSASNEPTCSAQRQLAVVVHLQELQLVDNFKNQALHAVFSCNLNLLLRAGDTKGILEQQFDSISQITKKANTQLIYRSARQHGCLSPSFYHTPFYRLQSDLCFLKSYSFLVSPAQKPFPHWLRLFLYLFQLCCMVFGDFECCCWSQGAHSMCIKHLHGSLTASSGWASTWAF